MFHHGHSDCVCPDLELPGHPEHQHCQPGCKSSMPTLAELDDPGYTCEDALCAPLNRPAPVLTRDGEQGGTCTT